MRSIVPNYVSPYSFGITHEGPTLPASDVEDHYGTSIEVDGYPYAVECLVHCGTELHAGRSLIFMVEMSPARYWEHLRILEKIGKLKVEEDPYRGLGPGCDLT
jgi:hypothetical protein